MMVAGAVAAGPAAAGGDDVRFSTLSSSKLAYSFFCFRVQDAEEGKSKTVKTSFTVKLTKFDDTKKVALIKEVKQHLENMNLVQAKQYVEKLPQIVKADLSKEDADKLKAALEAAGGTVELI